MGRLACEAATLATYSIISLLLFSTMLIIGRRLETGSSSTTSYYYVYGLLLSTAYGGVESVLSLTAYCVLSSTGISDIVLDG